MTFGCAGCIAGKRLGVGRLFPLTLVKCAGRCEEDMPFGWVMDGARLGGGGGGVGSFGGGVGVGSGGGESWTEVSKLARWDEEKEKEVVSRS